ncbi:MAG: ABC transporter substrate-binding protein [Candidatus Thorarchaeota archaeon]
MDWRVFRVVGILLLLGILVSSQVSAIDAVIVPEDLQIGPYVDRLVFFEQENKDLTILGLQAGEFEMQTGFVDPAHLPTLDDLDIDIFSALRNGYGYFTINCSQYPLNISALRRAFAYAFDKTAVTAYAMDGFSQEHDSIIPYISDWCIEDELDFHYYTAQPEVGNEILNAAGFAINGTTGWREAPDGSPFSIVIEYPIHSIIAETTCQIGIDALHALSVDAAIRGVEFNEYIVRCDGYHEFDILFQEIDFYDTEPLWLIDEFWSPNADLPYHNIAQFVNQTLDLYRDQFLHSTDAQQVHDAVSEIQKIIHYNVPWLVAYENTNMQMYRNDIFTGHVPDLARYIAGPWTMRNIHEIEPRNRIPTIALPEYTDTFNIFLEDADAHTYFILDNLYSSLYVRDPSQHPIGDLATTLTTETHSDNSDVPEGHTRFTINIIHNATWSDGTPLTAEDVAFTFTYILESGTYGNPMSSQLEDLQSAIALGPYTVRLEFNSEFYWHFNSFAFVKIIPKHIFNDQDGIGYANWDIWNPVRNPSDLLVTSGPFILTSAGQGYKTFRYIDLPFYELTQNPRYYYNPHYSETFIRSLEEITYFVGSEGNTIEWSTILNQNASYTLYRNSDVVAIGRWEGGPLVCPIDGLDVGNYVFTLDVEYDGGYSESSSVQVHVLSDLGPLPGQPVSPMRAVAIAISVVSIQVFLWVACVSRRDYKKWRLTKESIPEENPVDWFAEIFGSDTQDQA